MSRILAGSKAGVLLALGLSTTACSTINSVGDTLFGPGSNPKPGQVGYIEGFLGAVVADEPIAATAGREVLSTGGNAADAAVAVALTLSVTLPSRAGLGGGGGCIAFASGAKSINAGAPEAIIFPSEPPPSGVRGTRPAGLPMMARGLYLLHARYGSMPFETYLAGAEQLARFGVGVSRALVQDLNVVGGALLADPGARAVFAPNGVMIKEGDSLRQAELSTTLSNLRLNGVGDLYQGVLARRIRDNSPAIGGPLTLADLRSALPRLQEPLLVPVGNDIAAFLPPPADGGLAAAAAFQTLWANPSDLAGAEARALAVASAWRAGGASAEALLHGAPPSAYPLPPLPASTAFATLDRSGNAVVCALSMNNLFGTGRMFPGMGMLAAASPAAVPPPLLSAGLIWNKYTKSFRAAVGGSGQAGAPMAVAVGLSNTLRTQEPMAAQVPEPGRADVIACSRYLPSENRSCTWAIDPRLFGLALGGT
ncbi:MAG: gamma-glutamyltransferase [Acetobacteraceae bacterium]